MKKLLSLILTLALLSTMFVVGATTASAAAAAVTGETSYETEGYVHITEDVTGGTQTIYYNVDDTTDSTDSDCLRNYDGTKNYWSLLKFNVGNYSEIESIVLKLTAKRNKWSRIRVYSLSKTEYENAIANTVEGIKTLSTANEDTLLEAPVEDNRIAQTTATGSSGDSDYTDFSITLTSTTAKDAALADGYVYLALACSYTDSKGAVTGKLGYIKTPFDETAANRPALKITGTKPIEGLGTKVIAEKTLTVKAGESYHQKYTPAYTTTDASTGEEVIHAESNVIVYNGTGYQYVRAGQTPTGTYWNTYLSFDISELAGKDIDTAKLKLEFYRKDGKGNNLVSTSGVQLQRVTGLDTTFGALELTQGTNTLESKPEEPTLVGDVKTISSRSGAITNTSDIMGIVSDAIAAGEETVDIRVYNYRTHSSNQTNGLRLYQAGSSTYAPSITFTYTEEIDTATENLPAGKTFTFKGETSTTGAAVRLVVALYEGDTFLGAVASDVLTNGKDTLELPVDLSAYSTATKVKCYFWDGATLAPFMESTDANIAAAA